MTDEHQAEPAAAVLDDAHLGDIQGAFGTIRMHDTSSRRTWTARLLTLLAIMGPGLIVMVGDNDAGGVATYAQAGRNSGLTLLWTLPLLVPVLIVNQEMVVRLGAVTGGGHARLINERFGRFWGAFSVVDLFLLHFLTIATEFIGVGLALGYFGVSRSLSVPIAAVALVVMTATGSFRRWERFMFVFIAVNFLVIPLAVLSHPTPQAFFRGFVVPGVPGGFSSTSVLLMTTTDFPQVDVNTLAVVVGIVLLVVFAGGAVVMVRARSGRPTVPAVSAEVRANWRMPPLALLERPAWSRGKTVAMYALRRYLVAAVPMLLVKAIQLG
jgi:hypothetical protein